MCALALIEIDAKKAKADVAGAVVPEATVYRRQEKKEKTFGDEAGGSSCPSRSTSGWRRIPWSKSGAVAMRGYVIDSFEEYRIVCV